MGEVTREILANRSNKQIANQIIAPSGTEDPFYYQVEQHYGASDHEVFNHWSVHIPGVMLITWPDMYYHTSEDLPNKLDPTQLKRATIIAAAGAYNIASANERMACNIAETVFAHSSKRLAIELDRALHEVKNAGKSNFEDVGKKVSAYLETTRKNEIATLESVKELAENSENLRQTIQILSKSVDDIYEAKQKVLYAGIERKARELDISMPSFDLNTLEKKAAGIIPATTQKVKNEGYGVERTMRELPRNILDKFPYTIANTTELCALVNGKNSALDIKKMLDTQYSSETDLESVLNYLNLLKENGLVSY